MDDSVLLRGIPVVERDSRGRFYAAVPHITEQEVILYSSAGEIVRTIGRHGGGPGEFRWVWDVMVGTNDTLFVGHDGYMISVFDSAGRFVRGVRLDSPALSVNRVFVGYDAAGFVVGERAQFSDTVARPLHRYDHEGQHLRSFGPRDLRADYWKRRGRRIPTHTNSGWGPDGSIWLVGNGGYRLENTTLDGQVRRVIGVTSPLDWNARLFMTSEDYEDYMSALRPRVPQPNQHGIEPGEKRPTEWRPRRRPVAVARDVTVLNDTLVAVAVHVASKEWQKVRVRFDTTRYAAQSIAEPGGFERLYDTVLDVIDVRRGVVVARKRVVPGTGYFTHDGALYTSSVSDQGVIKIRAFEFELGKAGPLD